LVNILLDNPMTQFSFEWILSLNWLCQKWGQVQPMPAVSRRAVLSPEIDDFMNQDKTIRPAHELPPPHPDDSPVLLTIPEAARELRCSKTHVHNLIYGKVPHVPPLPVLRIGRRVLIRTEGLRAWMLSVEARETEAQKVAGLFR